MTENVKKMLELVRSKKYRSERINNEGYDMTEVYEKNPRTYETIMFEDMVSRETPYILEGDIFGFNRRNVYCPHYYRDGNLILCGAGNVTPNYRRVIESGFDSILEDISRYENGAGERKKLFYECMRRDIAAVTDICERYRKHAADIGNTRIAEALAHIPAKPARSFYEACLFFKIIVYTLRLANQSHVTIGRFDQYMYSYFKDDMEKGVSEEELFEILEMLFISLNVDNDVYFGMQQGDNGQSMVLGGFDKNGNDMFNDLSRMCMEASYEINMIDPKINLRVSKKTPDWHYAIGTRLTKQGLGFPQYCNDDIVVPYLISMGYDEDDAYNYTVAACWEFISPNNGFDIPNQMSFVLPQRVNETLHEHLAESKSFEEFMAYLNENIKRAADERISFYAEKPKRDVIQYLSLFIDGCLEKGVDISMGGAKYNNRGTHGTGLSNAADALAAVKKVVYDDKSVTPEELIAALNADFEGYEELRNTLIACPKIGNNDDYVDSIAAELIDYYAAAFNGRDNGQGGVWRAGSGSAQGYATHASDTAATADGRKANDYYACSFSPAITTKLNGPLSVIQSFTKFDLKKICNGGPLTMELHDTVFRNEEGEKKVAQLVKAFVMLGGHQLQLNSINRDRLLDAQEHPEDHKNLIVRVWGWSGYFCELDKMYQDHIIRRTEFSV